MSKFEWVVGGTAVWFYGIQMGFLLCGVLMRTLKTQRFAALNLMMVVAVLPSAVMVALVFAGPVTIGALGAQVFLIGARAYELSQINKTVAAQNVVRM